MPSSGFLGFMGLMMNHFMAGILALVGLMTTASLSAGESVFELPPVLERTYGKVYVMKGWSKSIRIHSGMKNGGATRILAPKTATDSDIAEALLLDFWEGNFRDDPIGELIDVDGESFAKNGAPILLGQPAGGDPLFRDWWRVRLGEPLRVSKEYQLAGVIIFHDDGGWEVGHFCIAVRKIGGDVDGDFMVDFRAPWHHDRAANFEEVFNFDNSLINQIIPSNLYDWLYTQSEFRGCRSELTFVPISDEQVRILKYVRDRTPRVRAGPFRPLKGNCASLGKAVMNRILPLDNGVGDEFTIADTPRRGVKIIDERLGAITTVVLRAHQREGLEPTSKSEIHPAEPSRRGSTEFKQLLQVPELN